MHRGRQADAAVAADGGTADFVGPVLLGAAAGGSRQAEEFAGTLCQFIGPQCAERGHDLVAESELQRRAEGRVDEELKRLGGLAIGAGRSQQTFSETRRQHQRQGLMAGKNAVARGFGIAVVVLATEGGGFVETFDQRF